MNVVQRTWLRQSRTEYTAAALTAQLVHWMVAMGLSPDLLRRGAQVIADEVDHAAICHALYLHAGGPPRQAAIQQQHLQHQDDPQAPMHLRAISAAAGLACEESVALPVFRLRVRNATEPKALETVTTILRDEATHRAFAWDLLDELRGHLGLDLVRAWVRPRIAWWLRIYLTAELTDDEPVYTADELGWGLIDRREHWTSMRQTVETQVIPRFQRLDLLEPHVTGDDLIPELVRRDGRLVPPWSRPAA
jgi:hypothetical protein